MDANEADMGPNDQPLLNAWERHSPARQTAVRRRRFLLFGGGVLVLLAVILGSVLGVQHRQRVLREAHERPRTILMQEVYRGRERVPLQVRAATWANIIVEPDVPEGLAVEELEFYAADDDQAWVPLRIIRPAEITSPAPVVIFLHGTNGNKDNYRPRQELYAMRGYLTCAVDARWHGDRCAPGLTPCVGISEYQQALVRSWKGDPAKPFLLDNVWEMIQLLDYLETREDVDSSRIAMTGTSLGGMHTWLTAVVDDRVAVAAPMIGIQGFQWAIDHVAYQSRVSSIPDVFEAARIDLGRSEIDPEVVTQVWNKIIPNLLAEYDSPKSLPLLAPRPLLAANGELDPRCPLPGVMEAMESAKKAYRAAGVPDDVSLFVERDLMHVDSPVLQAVIADWIDKHLLTPY